MIRKLTIGSTVLALALGLGGFALAQDDAEDSNAPLEVTEILMGTELESGVPTSPSTSFSRSDGHIYCMVRIRNRTGEAGQLRIAFERAGDGEPEPGARGRQFDYPARSRYRTVSRGTPNRAPGAYRCVVRTDEGAVLSHQDFTITE